MKKLLAGILALTILLAIFAGCKAETATTPAAQTDAAQGDKTEPAATDAPTAKETFKIAFLVVSGKLGDQATNEASWSGVQRFCAETADAECTSLELSELQDTEASVRAFCEQGYDLILFNSADASEFIPDFVTDYPDVKFMLLEGTAAEFDNVLNVRTTVADSGFICGAFCALMNEYFGGSKTAGFIGGVRNPNLERSQYGFTAGAEYVGGTCMIVYLGNFTDAAQAKELTAQMYGSGMHLVQAWAGGANTGVFEAAASAGEGYYAMGGATGQFHMSNSIIASQVKNSDNIMYLVCERAYNGTLEHGTITMNLAEDAVGIKYAPDGRDAVIPQEIKDKVEELRQKIISGEFSAPSTEAEYEAFKAQYLK